MDDFEEFQAAADPPEGPDKSVSATGSLAAEALTSDRSLEACEDVEETLRLAVEQVVISLENVAEDGGSIEETAVQDEDPDGVWAVEEDANEWIVASADILPREDFPSEDRQDVIDGDFADFANFQTTEPDDSAINAKPVDEDEDDDFGDFDQAEFSPTAVQAQCTEDEPMTICPPPSRELFKLLISQAFATDEKPCSIQNADTASFEASVERDFARCENVDDWECVVFRFEGSSTRKALLAALCIDETPNNCPRFALDCLKKEFLQPVKEGSSPADRCDNNCSQDLNERTKEVLKKIPDLSFMKAEVLTFPATIQAP